MSKSLEPALHDIGKLIDIWCFDLGGHDFRKGPRSNKVLQIEKLKALGVTVPSTETWHGIIDHMDEIKPANADIFLLKLADHAASAASRALRLDRDEKETYRARYQQRTGQDIQTSKTVYRVWNPEGSSALQLIRDEESLQALFKFLKQDPGEAEYFDKYSEMLWQRPEDLFKPLDVVGLGTHSKLVGKFYRFFKKHAVILQASAPNIGIEFGGQKAAHVPEDAENNWMVQVVYGEVKFAQEPIRARDLNIFSALAEQMERFASADNVFFHTSNQFLALMPPAQSDGESARQLEDLLHPFLKEGFYVDIEEARVFLEKQELKGEKEKRKQYIPELYENPLPRVLRERATKECMRRQRQVVPKRLAKIPDPMTRARRIKEEQQRLATQLEAQFPQDMVYPSDLPQRFGASICAVCQMEEGTVEWPKQHVLDTGQLCAECQVIVQEEEWPPDPELLCESCAAFLGDRLREGVTKETLGPRCYALRQQGIRLAKLNRWTDEPGSRVVWLKVALDMPLLVKTLEELYNAYVQSINSELGPVDVRLSLVAEFQRDYEAFLRALNTAIVAQFGKGNVEQVFALPESAMPNDLFCVKVGNLKDVLCLLKIYQDLMYPAADGGARFFCSRQVHETMPPPFFPTFARQPASPIRVAVSCSHARFPFFQHWRLMRTGMERADVYVNVVGKGEITASLEALAPLLLKADFRRKRAFHTLAEIGKVSEQLAKLKMHFRGDKDRWTYKSLREDLLPLGLSYQSILTLAKIMGD